MKGLSALKKFRALLRHRLLNARAGVFIASPVWIAPSAVFDMSGDGFELGGSITIQAGAKICAGAVLAPYGGSIVIHENVFIGPYCILYGHGGIEIKRNSMIAAHSMLVAAQHRIDRFDVPIVAQGSNTAGIVIDEDVWLGAGTKVLDGVTIAHGSVVGAGAVVVKSLDAYSVAVGIPAKVIRKRNEHF